MGVHILSIYLIWKPYQVIEKVKFLRASGELSQGWKERPVFGKIRYMNYAGCNRKFNIAAYIAHVDRMVSLVKKKAKDSAALIAAAK